MKTRLLSSIYKKGNKTLTIAEDCGSQALLVTYGEKIFRKGLEKGRK